MEMILQKDRLIELLQHPDARVREECAQALAQFFPSSEGVMKPLLQALRTYPESPLALGVHIPAFIPDEEDMQELLKLYTDAAEKPDSNSFSMRFHILNGFLNFPSEILEPHRQFLEQDKDFKREIGHLKLFEEFQKKPAEDLWKQLDELCAGWSADAIDKVEQQRAQLLADALALHPEQTGAYVTDLLNDAASEKYMLRDYAVPLAGILKLEGTIPALFRILAESDFMDVVHETSVKALGQIGTPAVLEGITQYYAQDEELRIHLADILGYMPYPYTEDFGVQLLEQEQDPEKTSFIAISLCDIFSLKGAERIQEIIEKQQYSPEIATLLDLIIPVYDYHGKDVDLSELERADKAFRDDFRANSPMGRMREQLLQGLDNFSKRHQSDLPEPPEPPRLQREEQRALPQKKGKAAQKRTKKKKKKKRK